MRPPHSPLPIQKKAADFTKHFSQSTDNICMVEVKNTQEYADLGTYLTSLSGDPAQLNPPAIVDISHLPTLNEEKFKLEELDLKKFIKLANGNNDNYLTLSEVVRFYEKNTLNKQNTLAMAKAIYLFAEVLPIRLNQTTPPTPTKTPSADEMLKVIRGSFLNSPYPLSQEIITSFLLAHGKQNEPIDALLKRLLESPTSLTETEAAWIKNEYLNGEQVNRENKLKSAGTGALFLGEALVARSATDILFSTEVAVFKRKFQQFCPGGDPEASLKHYKEYQAGRYTPYIPIPKTFNGWMAGLAKQAFFLGAFQANNSFTHKLLGEDADNLGVALASNLVLDMALLNRMEDTFEALRYQQFLYQHYTKQCNQIHARSPAIAEPAAAVLASQTDVTASAALSVADVALVISAVAITFCPCDALFGDFVAWSTVAARFGWVASGSAVVVAAG